MNKRIEIIDELLKNHPDAFFIFSNGLTSREASYFHPEDRCFYLLHGMGETLSIGIGFANFFVKCFGAMFTWILCIVSA